MFVHTVLERSLRLDRNLMHPLLARLVSEPDQARFDELANIVLDHAMLADGAQLDSPADYVRRINQLILDLNRTDHAGDSG